MSLSRVMAKPPEVRAVDEEIAAHMRGLLFREANGLAVSTEECRRVAMLKLRKDELLGRWMVDEGMVPASSVHFPPGGGALLGFCGERAAATPRQENP